MPNPFIRLGSPNRSSVDVDNDRSRPTGSQDPIPEKVAGPVFAYRGQETHGVKPEGTWRNPEEYEGDYRYVSVDSVPIEEEPDPIPVRIVQEESGRFISRFRIFRAYAPGSLSGNSSAVILSADYMTRQRTRVVIKNLDSSTVYIGASEQEASAMHGWPLAQNETITINAEDDIFATSTGTNNAALSVQIEYQQVLNGRN